MQSVNSLYVNGTIAATGPISNSIIANNINVSSNLNVVGNIYATGSVGINTTTPGYTLDVNGTVGCANRLYGTVNTSNSDYFWIGLKGTGSEVQRTGIGITGNSTTGLIDNIRMYTNSGVGNFVMNATGYVGIGTAPNVPLQMDYGSASFIGTMYNGMVKNSLNNNNGLTVMHRLGLGQGAQFSGNFIASSWTGNAFIIINFTVDYSNDNVAYQVLQASNLNSGQAQKITLQLVKFSYNSANYVGILKSGSYTGNSFINAFYNCNVTYPFEITSGYTITQTIATLN